MEAIVSGGWLGEVGDELMHFERQDPMTMLKFATAGVLTCASAYLLHYVNEAKLEWTGLFTRRTEIILGKSYAHSLLSSALTVSPGVIAKKMGFSAVFNLISGTVYYNIYTTLVCYAGATVLYLMAMQHPFRGSRNLKRKRQLFFGGNIGVGLLMAPLFAVPGSLVSLAAQYTAAMIIPLSLASVWAKNRLTLNLSATAGMIGGIAYLQDQTLPRYISQGEKEESESAFMRAVLKVADTATSRLDMQKALATVAAVSAFSMMGYFLTNLNTLVTSIQRGDEKKTGGGAGGAAPTAASLASQVAVGSSLWYRIQQFSANALDPDDFLGFAMLINLHTMYAFAKILRELLRYCRYVLLKSKSEASRARRLGQGLRR